MNDFLDRYLALERRVNRLETQEDPPAGGQALHSYYRPSYVGSGGGRLYGSSGARDSTYAIPWVESDTDGAGTRHTAPVLGDIWAGETYDTFIAQQDGLYLVDYTFTAVSQQSSSDSPVFSTVKMFLQFGTGGGTTEWLRATAAGTGDDFGQPPMECSGNLAVVRYLTTDMFISAKFNADGQWRLLSAGNDGGGTNFWGTSLGITYLGDPVTG